MSGTPKDSARVLRGDSRGRSKETRARPASRNCLRHEERSVSVRAVSAVSVCPESHDASSGRLHRTARTNHHGSV